MKVLRLVLITTIVIFVGMYLSTSTKGSDKMSSYTKIGPF